MATCKDCIYEEKCISRISHYMDIDEATGEEIADIEKRCGSFKNKADFVEVRHGEWVEIAENSTGKLIYCTNCNEPINPNKKDVELHRTKEKPDFCPHCGAKMDGKEDEK